MKRVMIGWLGILVALVFTGSLLAHHSLGNFDTTKAVRVKGTIIQFNMINPHTFLFLEEKIPDAYPRRWAVEGPSVVQLNRAGFAKDALKVGDVVEICGYLPKENITWQIAMPEHSPSIAGRLINAETLVMPDGKLRGWGDYGFHKCFEAGYVDQHSR
jgi:hypothetical protein